MLFSGNAEPKKVIDIEGTKNQFLLKYFRS